MLRRILSAAALFSLLGALALAYPGEVSAQDAPAYALWESTYVDVLPGHGADFSEAMARHNQRYHGPGPYNAQVYYMVNGNRAGQYFWVMGPMTWTLNDARPNDEAHTNDWENEVMQHAEPGLTEYWRMMEDISTLPADATPAPIIRMRFFEVNDMSLFVETQRQIEETAKAMGDTGTRVFLAKQFRHRDPRDVVLVTDMQTWSELDEPGGGNFGETFRRVHGEAAWALFQQNRDRAVESVWDDWLQLVPEMSGPPM